MIFYLDTSALLKRYLQEDAVQLAAGLTLNAILLQTQRPPLTFLSADVHLIQAAQNEGLTVDNPNLHP